MRESDNRYEILERARETLRRVDDADRRRRFEAQQEDVDNINRLPVYAPRAAEWDPANPRGLTVKTMNRAEFNAWCDAGRPPLTAPVATVTKSKVDALVRAAIDHERANTQTSLEAFAAIIGEECGRNEKALRAEINALRAEISQLRRELDSGAIELPGPPKDWRHAATH